MDSDNKKRKLDELYESEKETNPYIDWALDLICEPLPKKQKCNDSDSDSDSESSDDESSTNEEKTSEPRILEKVISGAQDGADIIALEVAKECGIETGGCVPPNCFTISGPKPHLIKQYNLTPIDDTSSTKSMSYYYVTRSTDNVRNSQGTLVFKSIDSPGTDCTINFSIYKCWVRQKPKLPTLNSLRIASYSEEYPFKPTLVINPVKEGIDLQEEAERIRGFISKYKVSVLNVAGHSKPNFSPKYIDNIKAILRLAFA